MLFQQKKFEEKEWTIFWEELWRDNLLKNPSIYAFSIFDFFATKSPFKEGDGEQQKFVEDLCLLVV